MTSLRNARRLNRSFASLILVTSIAAFGCGGDEPSDAVSMEAEVTANNFADLAAASAEVAREVYLSKQFTRGIARQVYLNLLQPSPAHADPLAAPAAPGVAICDSGSATLTTDQANPGRHEIEYVDCVQIEDGQTCTIDGTLVIREGAVGGAPLTAEGVALDIDCSLLGSFDLDGSRVSCAYDGFDGDPTFNSETCTFDIPNIQGNVSGLDFAVSEIETSGFPWEVAALGKLVDPDHGEFSFEATDLDFDTCGFGVPFTGLIGGGRVYGTAPLFWAIFDGSCDAFTACFFETQEDLDAFECTLESVVLWDDIAGPQTEGVVQPVAVVATSYYNAPTAPIHLIDGSGLSGVGPLETQTHAGSANAVGMWHAGPLSGALGGPAGDPPTVSGQALEFDLGLNLNLEGAYVWNSFQTGQTARGVDAFEILVSSSEAGPFVSLGSFSLQQNSDDPLQTGTIAQFRAFQATNVRRVRFEIASSHSGAPMDYVGLSEVAFLASGAAD